MSGGVQSAVIIAVMLATAGGVATKGQAARENVASDAKLTPGQVALLGNSLDAAALERLRGAIRSPDPMVRAVAARLVAVSKPRALADAIASAWAQEQEPGAAAEQARALLMLRGGSAADSIEARLDWQGIATVYAE